jgi:hypothetical protein
MNGPSQCKVRWSVAYSVTKNLVQDIRTEKFSFSRTSSILSPVDYQELRLCDSLTSRISDRLLLQGQTSCLKSDDYKGLTRLASFTLNLDPPGNL